MQPARQTTRQIPHMTCISLVPYLQCLLASTCRLGLRCTTHSRAKAPRNEHETSQSPAVDSRVDIKSTPLVHSRQRRPLTSDNDDNTMLTLTTLGAALLATAVLGAVVTPRPVTVESQPMVNVQSHHSPPLSSQSRRRSSFCSMVDEKCYSRRFS